MKPVRDQRWSAAEVSRLITLLNGERHYLEMIFDALPVAVAIVGGDLSVRAANAAFAALFGLDADGAAGIPLLRATGDRGGPAAVLDALDRGERTVAIANQQFLCTRIPGSDDILLVESAAEALPGVAESRPQPFEERMSAVSQLAGGLSHELNNILTIVTSYCHLAIEQAEASGAPTADLHAILKAAGEVSQIGAQLVHIGGRHISQDGRVDVNSVVAALGPRLRQLCEGRVLLEIDTHPDVPPAAGDPGQIEAVVAAIAEHAADAVGDGGRVTVRTAPGADRRSAELIVEDDRDWPDGSVGVRLFEPYAPYPGSKRNAGLKLAAAYSIVRHCGGEITTSAAGGRTVITVRLPGRPVEKARAAERTATAVLLVDDKDDVRSAIREMLDRQGYQVVEAAGPREALRVLEQSGRVDILLSDIDMPDMSGRELARRARRMRPALKVVMMSGYADERVTMGAREENGFVFLQKPFSPDRLAAALHRVSERD